jgi:hypothetical protein
MSCDWIQAEHCCFLCIKEEKDVQDDNAFVVGEPISKLSQKLLHIENIENFTFTGISMALNSAAYKISVFIEGLVENM